MAVKIEKIALDQSPFKNCRRIYAILFLEGHYSSDEVQIVGLNRVTEYFNDENGFDVDDIQSVVNLKVGETMMTEEISGYPLITRLK
jgi:hypothetical protein